MPFGNSRGQGFNNPVVSSFRAGNVVLNKTGVFIYSPVPGLGNLIISEAPAAGTDQYGNVYPQGLNVTVGTIKGVAISGSTFTGTDYIQNSAGTFFYSGTPAAGNLIASVAAAAGADGFGNAHAKGINEYAVYAGVTYAIGLNAVGSTSAYPGIAVQSLANPPSSPPGIFGVGSATRATLIITSGNRTGGDVASYAQFSSAAEGAVTNGELNIFAGYTTIGNEQTVIVDDNHGLLELTNEQGSVPPAPAVGVGFWTDLNGFGNIIATGDDQSYKLGHKLTTANSGQSISGTGFTGIVSNNVGVGSYLISGHVIYTGSAATGTPKFTFGGTATQGHARGHLEFGLVTQSIIDGLLTGSYVGPTLTGGEQIMTYEFDLAFTSAGSLTLFAGENAGATSFVINSARLRQEAV